MHPLQVFPFFLCQHHRKLNIIEESTIINTRRSQVWSAAYVTFFIPNSNLWHLQYQLDCGFYCFVFMFKIGCIVSVFIHLLRVALCWEVHSWYNHLMQQVSKTFLLVEHTMNLTIHIVLRFVMCFFLVHIILCWVVELFLIVVQYCCSRKRCIWRITR